MPARLTIADAGTQQAIKRLMASPDAAALFKLLESQRVENTQLAVWEENEGLRETARARAQCYEVLTNTLKSV